MFLITRDKLADACRAHDNAVDVGTSFVEVWQRRGVDAKDAVYVANQRALRLVLQLRGQAPSTHAEPVKLSRAEQEIAAHFAAMWLDGLAVGLKCREGGGG